MGKLTDGNGFALLQKVGTAFFLPVSILPGAGLLLGIGASFTNQDTIQSYHLTNLLGSGTPLNGLLLIMSQVGSTIFGNLPLIFALAVALGFAKKEKAVAVLSAGISFLVMHSTINVLLKITGQILPNGKFADSIMSGAISDVCGISSLQMGVFGGILVGIITALLTNRFYKQELPAAFSFFAGVRFIPIISMFAFVGIGIASFFVWPVVQKGIFALGDLVLTTGYLGTFIFGFTERILIPFGLHHIFYIPFWQTGLGGNAIIDGVRVFGAQNIFFAELASPNTTSFSVEACRFMTGKYAVMMAGLPGAALAMYHCAKPKNRALVGGLLMSAAMTSFFTGITEPIEFTFLFIAPALYVLHCALAGISFLLVHFFQICIGTTFSCGLVDFTLYGLLQGAEKTNWPMILPIFLVYFLLYYFLFRIIIVKFNLLTPGRDDNENNMKLYTKAEYKKKIAEDTIDQVNSVIGDGVSEVIAAGLGGIDNVTEIACCATRLRLTLRNVEAVDQDILKSTGAIGIVKKGEGIQIIYGPKVSVIKSNFEEYVEAACKQAKHEQKDILLYAAADGTAVPLSEVEDEVFSSGSLGDGYAIKVENGEVFAPVNGVISMITEETKHAIGISFGDGLELLIHIGIDTVNMQGEGFNIFVRQGQAVHLGDKLLSFDKDKVEEQGFKSDVIVVLLKKDKIPLIKYNFTGHVKAGETIIGKEECSSLTV